MQVMMLLKVMLKITGKFKPFLLKILPHPLLRKMKGRIIEKGLYNMKNIKIEPFERAKYPDGVNLIGNIRAEIGLGQSLRLVAGEISESNLDFSIYNYEQIGTSTDNNHSWDAKISDELKYNINLIHINPHEMGVAYAQLDKSFWDYRYNIAFWLWELEEFPKCWEPCFSCLDEIWTPSEFISDSIRKKTNLPVKTIPYCVSVTIHKEYGRDFFHLPNQQFLYLVMYDSNSVVERKNPKAVFDAFKLSFSKEDDKVGLVVKINDASRQDIKQVEEAMMGYDNIYLITETLDKDQVNSLIKCCDVLVSLHRAEGFGLVLAEAMLLGTPTIATNWSSNTEFMTSEVSCLVDYKLITITKDMGPFKKGNHWADPDVSEAAGFMKKLYEDKDFYDRIAENAETYIRQKLSMEQATEIIKKRTSEIWGIHK